MRLFLTIEAQNCDESGLANILWETTEKLKFITDKTINLEDINNYGTEFREIAIIPSCVDDDFWNTFGWKERKQIWRKKREADIRLKMNYDLFVQSTYDQKRLLFADIIVKSLQVVQERSKGDFNGTQLIRDVLDALTISEEQLKKLSTSVKNAT